MKSLSETKTYAQLSLSFLNIIDLLDEFEGPSNPKAASNPAKAGGQGVPKGDSTGSLDDDFARQLQLGMQDLLGEIQDSVRESN